ncbi:hypothetical protein B0H16DRAFT_1812866 [Mycena metata]|uniref:Uncharacterized protein n=1 Tax=Mycena metata TaxID=1033252 RepID=A0AAD7H562_9AGAR|nr:hypothetical protein B0H16DRAFT_1812866 [Mycena metata]
MAASVKILNCVNHRSRPTSHEYHYLWWGEFELLDDRGEYREYAAHMHTEFVSSAQADQPVESLAGQDDVYGSDASSLLSSAPVTRSQTPISLERSPVVTVLDQPTYDNVSCCLSASRAREDDAYDSDTSSLLSSAPITRSETPVSLELGPVPVSFPVRIVQDSVLYQPTPAQSSEAEAHDVGPVTGCKSAFPSQLQPAPLRYPPLESILPPFTRYRFQLFRLRDRIHAAVRFARRHCPTLNGVLQQVAGECDKLYLSLPPQHSPIGRISDDDMFELFSVYPKRPETAHYFPASLSPLLQEHRQQLGVMSGLLRGVTSDLSRPAANPIVASAVYIRRVEQLLSQVS